MLHQAISLLGMVVFLFIAWILSTNRRLFPWRTVVWGLALQLAFALVILKSAPGQHLFEWIQTAFLNLNAKAMDGAALVFGPLAEESTISESFGPGQTVPLGIIVLATIILIASLSALLYHWGLLQRVVAGMALIMQRSMKTSGSESLAAAANVFMGQTEAPLLIKPYLKGLTRSELLAVMTGGMATIAGGVLAAYVSFGASAGHLLTASVLSAPGALIVSKIMCPEEQASQTAGSVTLELQRETTNSLDALCKGASDGLKLSLNVLAMLIAFVALVALANLILEWLTGWMDRPITLQAVLGWINAPFAWLMGVPWKDAALVGTFLGERIVLNEFVGYLSLTTQKNHLDPRSFTLATYALCGFANFGSIAIQIGGISVLAPERRADLARLGWRSMVAGLLTCYLTACLVGVLTGKSG